MFKLRAKECRSPDVKVKDSRSLSKVITAYETKVTNLMDSKDDLPPIQKKATAILKESIDFEQAFRNPINLTPSVQLEDSPEKTPKANANEEPDQEGFKASLILDTFGIPQIGKLLG